MGHNSENTTVLMTQKTIKGKHLLKKKTYKEIYSIHIGLYMPLWEAKK
jgi:hypothetical protein